MFRLYTSNVIFTYDRLQPHHLPVYDFRSMLIEATKPHQGIVYLSGFLLTIFIARIIGISTSKLIILI